MAQHLMRGPHTHYLRGIMFYNYGGRSNEMQYINIAAVVRSGLLQMSLIYICPLPELVPATYGKWWENIVGKICIWTPLIHRFPSSRGHFKGGTYDTYTLYS